MCDFTHVAFICMTMILMPTTCLSILTVEFPLAALRLYSLPCTNFTITYWACASDAPAVCCSLPSNHINYHTITTASYITILLILPTVYYLPNKTTHKTCYMTFFLVLVTKFGQ